MTRWMKVWRDLGSSRTRTILVILSIAVGVLTIGLIASAQQALTESLAAQYAAMLPADIILHTEPALDDDFVRSLRNMRGVAEAEGRRALALRISLDGRGETWRDLTLYALPDYEDQRLFLVRPDGGDWPPQKGEVLIERASLAYLGLAEGDTILVKTPAGRQHHLAVAGQAHDLYRIPPVIEGWLYGYVSMDTLRWMGQPEGSSELYLKAPAGSGPEEIRALAEQAEKRIEGLGLPVYQKTLPTPGEHPLGFIITTVLLLLGLLAALAMFLSALLVINVISALIAQQERQIGVMKAVGARSGQIFGLYAGMVLALGLAACLLAVPLSALGAGELAAFIAGLINFDPPEVQLSGEALLLMLGVGLLAPLLAAAPAIGQGTRVAPASVLSEYGINQGWSGSRLLDAVLGRLRLRRDLLLAARNPFRKSGRLALSLITLTFAGAVFLAIVNLQASLNGTLDQMLGFWNYDAWLVIDRHAPAERLVNTAQAVPGVAQAEAWGFTIGRSVRPDGSESDNLYLLAPPTGTEMLHPPIIAGRGLRPGDTDAILVSPGLLANEPGLRLGGQVSVKIEGRERVYTIVGVMNMMGNSTIGYFTVMDYETYALHVREPNRANAVILRLAPGSTTEQRVIAGEVEKAFDRANLNVLSNFLVAEEREEIDGAFGIIVALLMVMTLVLATVGGLGLMGSMSLNVIERTREIGVMRAYGASGANVFRVVLIEGLLIGLMSWALAIVLSLPISSVLARVVGESFMDYPMPAVYAPGGVLVWAALVIVISAAASLLPALRAVRLTVTEVLAYE